MEPNPLPGYPWAAEGVTRSVPAVFCGLISIQSMQRSALPFDGLNGPQQPPADLGGG